MMTFRQLKQCNLIDIRAFYDTEEYGIRAKHSYVELSRSIPHEQLFYYAIPCYNEGVYWYSKGKYIYWKLQEVNSSEHFISVYLKYYFLNDGIWSCGPSGTVKYVLNSTSGIEGCEIICQKEYSSEDLLFLLNDKIVGWNKIEANIWDQAKREYATLLKNSWKEQNIDEHEATLIRPFLVNTIFLSIQLVKNKVSCPKSSVKKGTVLPQTAPVGTSNAERPVRIVGSIFVSVQQKYTESGEYFLTHIIVNDPSNQVKGGLSNDSWGSYREYPTTYAGRTGAAVTTNGSYFSYDSGQPVCAGCFIKDGKILKDGVTNGKEICLDNTGKFYTPSAGISASTLLASGVKDIWGTADPLLIQDGQKVDLANQQKINNTYYNRTAIGMVQPGEYYMITAGTAQYKNGLSFAELQSIFANLGCTYARSMDGGGSSSLVVNGKLLNTPAQYDERPVVDFLSFLP